MYMQGAEVGPLHVGQALSPGVLKAIQVAQVSDLYNLGFAYAKLVKEVGDITLDVNNPVCLRAVNAPRFSDSPSDRDEGQRLCPLRPVCKDVDTQSIYDILPVHVQLRLDKTLQAIEKESTSHTCVHLCELRFDVGLLPRILVSQQAVTKLRVEKCQTRCYTLHEDDSTGDSGDDDEAASCVTTKKDVEHMLTHDSVLVGDADKHRMYIRGTNHRVSTVIESSGESPSGLACNTLTIRVGRHVPNAADIIFDIVMNSGNGSVLVLGPPGSGKTTVMRSMARLAAGDLDTGCDPHNNVFVVDTSHELSCDEPSDRTNVLGYARVVCTTKKRQQESMEEVLLNHFPSIIAIDELDVSNVSTVRRITSSGVRLFATAHASSLQEAVYNPVTGPLLGDMHTVIRSDTASVQAGTAKKSVLERMKEPMVQTVVQLDTSGFLVWQQREHLCAAIDDILAADGNNYALHYETAPQRRIWPSRHWLHKNTENEKHLMISHGWGNGL
jgi:stage III sporulation protein SpoIIIAA